MTEEIIEQLRACTKCGEPKPPSCFYRAQPGHGINGRRSECKECSNRVNRQYAVQHQPQISAFHRQYRIDHALDLKSKARAYYLRSIDRHRIARRAWYQANKERHAQAGRVWRDQFPEHSRVIKQRHRVLKRSVLGVCTAEQWIARCGYYGWRCYLCGIELTSGTLQMEHRIPICRGGSHWPANLAPACRPCNQAKDKKTEAEYRASVHANFTI